MICSDMLTAQPSHVCFVRSGASFIVSSYETNYRMIELKAAEYMNVQTGSPHPQEQLIVLIEEENIAFLRIYASFSLVFRLSVFLSVAEPILSFIPKSSNHNFELLISAWGLVDCETAGSIHGWGQNLLQQKPVLKEGVYLLLLLFLAPEAESAYKM